LERVVDVPLVVGVELVWALAARLERRGAFSGADSAGFGSVAMADALGFLPGCFVEESGGDAGDSTALAVVAGCTCLAACLRVEGLLPPRFPLGR
jgi:hypothetical protein